MTRGTNTDFTWHKGFLSSGNEKIKTSSIPMTKPLILLLDTNFMIPSFMIDNSNTLKTIAYRVFCL